MTDEAQRDSRRARLLYVAVFTAGLAFTVWLWLHSPGTSFQDEIGHYLLARNSWNYPSLALNLWGRVANTLIYMVPSRFGLDGARFASVVMSALAVLLATRVGGRIGVRRLWLVPLLLWFQYWGADLMYSASTTVPFTLFIILAIDQWMAGRIVPASLAFGLLPLIRHEGIALLGLWGLHLLVRRDWRAIAVAALPTLLYNAVVFVALHPPLAKLPMFIYVTKDVDPGYGAGTWFHYVVPTMRGIGAAVGVWTLIGLLPAWRVRGRLLHLLPYPILFLVHSVVYHFNTFKSGGYYMFISPIAPGVAIVAALGADAVIDRLSAASLRRFGAKWGARVACAAAAVLVVAPVVYKALRTVTPRPLEADERATQEAARWLRTQPVDPRNVVSTHVYFFHFYDLPWRPGQIWSNPAPVAQLARGSVVVWDRVYSDRFGMTRDGFREELGWRRIAQFGADEIEIFERK